MNDLADDVLIRKGWFDDINYEKGISESSHARKISQGYTKEELFLFRSAFAGKIDMKSVPCKCNENQYCDRCRLMELRKRFG